MVNLDEHTLFIEPVVAWPRVAETECDYLVTVDLRGPLPEDDTAHEWPYPEEEFTFTVALDGSPYFVCTALDEPSVVLHRFGGTYGPAHFRVSTGRATGNASLWLTVSNQWGVPVRKAELLSEIRDRAPGRAPAARLAAIMSERATRANRLSETRPTDVDEQGGNPSVHESAMSFAPLTPPRHSGPPGADRVHHRPRRLRTGRQTVTLSFADFDRAWAEWIGHRLEERGHRVVLQLWDPPRGTRLRESLQDLLLSPGPVLMLLSEQYFRLGTWTREEWDAALREVMVPDAQRIAAVTVAPSVPPAPTALLDAVPLYDVRAEDAELRLLDRLDLPTDPPSHAQPDPTAPPFPVHTLRVWGRVPERNERFTGRVPLLNMAYELLQREHRVTLHGVSGVGKTQLATEYAYRFASGYHVVWWVNAANQATFRQSLADLAPALGLSTGTGYGERLRAVREALRTGDPYPRWLLILDGADEPDEIRNLVPSGPGHVLITSCDAEWGDRRGALLEVPAYDRHESVAFIRRRAPRLTSADAHRLADVLRDLPLLLDQTAGWLDESGVPVEDYLGLLTGSTGPDDPVSDSDVLPMSFSTALTVLLNKFRAAAPESVQLLKLCTFFAPDAVPVHVLRSMPTSGLPPGPARLLTDTARWDRAVEHLRKLSWIRVERPAYDPAKEFLSLHRMVHQTVRHDLAEEECREGATTARRALVAADPGAPTDVAMWSRYAELVPHLEYADLFSDDDAPAQQLVLNCLRYLYLSGEYDTGLRLAEQVLTAWRHLEDERPELLWDFGHHYANLLRALGDYRTSESVSRAVIEAHRATGGTRQRPYLRAIGSLAADLRVLGRYEEALDLSEEACLGYTELEGDQGPFTLAARNNKSVSLRLLGRYEEALAIGLDVLRDRREVLGDRHVWTLFSENWCAIDLRLLGRYREALDLQSNSLSRHKETLGKDHTQTLFADYNLAQCQYRMDDLEGAEARFADVLARGERMYGRFDARSLIFAVAQCCFAREHGDVDEARRSSELVCSRYERLLGPTHPYAVGTRANHALVLRAVGERRQAHTLAERALAEMSGAVGPGHPWTLGCAINASATRTLVGRPEQAAELSRDTVARAARALGPHHPLARVAQRGLDADVRAVRDSKDAERSIRARLYWNFEPQTT
ncbi:FxSxx-COOH system tetratricopeptide repeat protein [Streptomyces sp. MB09-02B]|uniref:FxSxx-COOH system tetratricopeptide repeat protein n=1 Tax=Streptomyces sp. MB09-02B TaxID=3028667 RepID=UPI0029AF2AB6|nr:FxSxx-COOH system tetratricopeptide repeat protein [Streptomyces sp. MB09-02B]MDX3642917.1 FxSxx-COOH system tetratricopeptide repeat protein [Streptomyces sp. MB09-02B]